jgi:Zinc carboxypeptidase
MYVSIGRICSKKLLIYLWFLALAPALAWVRLTAAAPVSELVPPIERVGYTRISTSAEISAFWDELVSRTPLARKEIIGSSAQGRAIESIIFSRRPEAGPNDARMTSLVIGSQHGFSEPAGGEALMVIAKQLVDGPLRPLLDEMDVVMIANANPDGRDLRRRANANWVNINTDFVLLSQPESLALKNALARYRPEAVLDSHESAVYKRQTLAREGYLTDFNAQFESANNPAVLDVIASYAYGEMLPEMVRRVTAGGLPAARYIGEITSTRQTITNGGLTLRNYRNTGGLGGAFSFLVETKLDSRQDTFPTFRNIAVRIDRQILCITSFLQIMHERRDEIMRRVTAARRAAITEPVTLYADYIDDPAHPFTFVPLRRLEDRTLENVKFRDFRKIFTADTVSVPDRYVIARHGEQIQEILARHGVVAKPLTESLAVEVTALRVDPSAGNKQRVRVIGQEMRKMQAESGMFIIDLDQTNGRLATLLLDPRSTSSIFRYPQYQDLINAREEFFVYASARQSTTASSQ